MRCLFIFLMSLVISNLSGQETSYSNLSNSQKNKQTFFSINYTYQIPKGSLSEKFGDNSSIQITYLIEKPSNLFFGIELGYLFGNNVKDSMLFESISTTDGYIIGSDGRYATELLMQRGFDSYLFLGYAIHSKPNNLSGLYLSAGLGYLQHKIFIDTRNQNLPQLNNEYKKGYDLLTDGISSKLSIDYKYFSRQGFQFSIGVNYILARTKNQRTYSFNEMLYLSNKKKWDQLLGFKAGIIIPIQKVNQEEYYYK